MAATDCDSPRVLDDNVDKFEDPSVPLFIVMEHVNGDTLSKLVIGGEPLTLEASVEIGLDICRSLAAAHEADVLHRDLKPANLVVRTMTPPTVAIVDFGLSFNKTDEEGLTQVGELIDKQVS